MKARSAIILVESGARRDADALGRLLDFFGVQHRAIFADTASEADAQWLRSPETEVALLASGTGMVLAEKRGLLNVKSLRDGTAPFQAVLVHAGAQAANLPIAFALLLDTPCRVQWQRRIQTAGNVAKSRSPTGMPMFAGRFQA